MQHNEQAGVHPVTLLARFLRILADPALVEEVKRARPAKWLVPLNVVGLMNVQFRDSARILRIIRKSSVLEVNPRASRTVPFVSKSTGQQLAKIAARRMVGQSPKIRSSRLRVDLDHYSVKEAVFPRLLSSWR